MRLRYLGVIAFLLSTSVAWGDGCYIPERAIRKIPEIAAQHAVLSWKDGVETLVISSALDSEAQRLGWIIPVPAVPQGIEKATPGALKTLDFCIQPRIIHDLTLVVRATVLVVLVVNLLLATWLFKRELFKGLLLLLYVLFLLASLMLPALGTAGAGATTNLSQGQVEKTATVGSYAISILRPSRPDGLDTWLAGNDFAALPEAARPTIADYIAKGWVFAAIKLTRTETGANVPHPIKLVFSCKDAVYPMKLTAIAGGEPGFEVFVIANERASCEMLKERFCDRFSKVEYRDLESDSVEPSTWFAGATTSCVIGHSAICSLMWPGCVLTKFVGTIDASRMTKDIQFTWTPFSLLQEHFFTQYGARCLGVIIFVVVLGGWNIVSMRDYSKGLVQSGGFKSYVRRRLVSGIVVAVILGFIGFVAVPKLSRSDVLISRGPGYRAFCFTHDFSEPLSKHPEVLARTEAEIADFLSHHWAAAWKNGRENVITGADLKLEDSPGNFTVEKKNREVVVRAYDRSGTAFVKTYRVGVKDTSGQSDSATGSAGDPIR